MTPAMISPSRSRPIEMAKCGTPCRKLVVPSSGSTIQRLRPSPLVSPPSSPRKPYSGRVRASSARSVRSALMSAWLTKSPGPFSEICRCSTSPKSRFRLLAAAEAERIITVMVAERGASERRSGGPERSRPGAIGARPTRATGRSVGGVISILGAFHVAALFGIDHQPGAHGDVRRYHHADAAFDDGGLVGRRGGLALHHGVGLGDGEHDALGQFDADRRALVERDGHFHAVLQPARLVRIENVGAHGELLVVLLVHEGEAVVVLEQVGALALVDMDVLDGLARAEALLQLVAFAQGLGLDGDEGAALSGADMLHLGRHPELAVVFDDVSGTDGIDRHFHGLTAGRMNGIRPRPRKRCEAGAGLYQRRRGAATGALRGPIRFVFSWAGRRR